MSATPRKQWLLKVISGPHQGAEISLNAGKTLIGSDDECDVVLHDVLVAPQHVELEVAETGLTAAPMGGRVFIGGRRVREARQKVPEFAFVSIGGSHLVIGPTNGIWPLLSAADVPELEKEVEATPAEAADEQSAAGEPAPAGATAAVVPSPTAAAPAGRPAQPRAVSYLGIAAGVVLLLGWAYVYYDLKGNRGEDAAAATAGPSKPVERARAIIEDMGLVGSVKAEEVGGRLMVTGYVDTDATQRELQSAFRVELPGVRTRVYNLEKIAASARSLIDNAHLPLLVSSLAEGKLKIAGTLPAAEPWIKMRQTLLSEVPGINGIEDSVEIAAPRPPAVQAAISTIKQATAGVPPQVSAPVSSPEPPRPATYQPPQPDPQTDLMVTPDTIDTPEATVATIRAEDASGLAYVRLSTGGVYFSGARLPYGGTIDRIEADTVTVIEKGATRVLHQGDAAMRARNTTATQP